jgi:hypothetical protein
MGNEQVIALASGSMFLWRDGSCYINLQMRDSYSRSSGRGIHVIIVIVQDSAYRRASISALQQAHYPRLTAHCLMQKTKKATWNIYYLFICY